MSLYDLPKDMLVKLITTIEQDTISKFEKQLENRLKNEEIQGFYCAYCSKLYSFLYDWKFNFLNDPLCKNCVKTATKTWEDTEYITAPRTLFKE